MKYVITAITAYQLRFSADTQEGEYYVQLNIIDTIQAEQLRLSPHS